jgi:hypothetical protein
LAGLVKAIFEASAFYAAPYGTSPGLAAPPAINLAL